MVQPKSAFGPKFTRCVVEEMGNLDEDSLSDRSKLVMRSIAHTPDMAVANTFKTVTEWYLCPVKDASTVLSVKVYVEFIQPAAFKSTCIAGYILSFPLI